MYLEDFKGRLSALVASRPAVRSPLLDEPLDPIQAIRALQLLAGHEGPSGSFGDTIGTQGTLEFWGLVWYTGSYANTTGPCLHPEPPPIASPHSRSIPTPGPRTPEPFRSSYNRLERNYWLQFLSWRMVTSSKSAWWTCVQMERREESQVGERRGGEGARKERKGLGGWEIEFCH